jgi:hypothetical protein
VSIAVALGDGANVVDDVLALLGVSGPGVIEFHTPYTEVAAYSRRTTGVGSVGDIVQGTSDLDEAALYPRLQWRPRSYRLLAVDVDGTTGHRTGVRWVNPSQEPGRAAVALRTAAGEVLGHTVVELTPRRAGRIDDVFAELGVAGRADCSLEVEVVEGWGAVMAWTVVSDQANGDERVVAARAEERNGPLVLYRDAGTGELDATVLMDGDVVAPVAPFQLAALVLDVTHSTSRVGYLSLYPLPRAP